MPNWKKLIVSGSDASLNSLNVTNNVTAQSFTGSFSGSFTAPGATTQIVYNSGGALAADSGLVYSGSRVGIGTTSPSSILEISQATPTVRIGSSDVTQFHGIEFLNGGNLDAFIKQLPQTGEFKISNGRGTGWGGHITLYTDTAERMRITSAGNVGIGTTSPGAKLHVASGEIRVDAGQAVTLDTGNVMYLVGASSQLRLYNGGNPIVNITTGGNVGIGTTSPSQVLEVQGQAQIGNDNVTSAGLFIARKNSNQAKSHYFLSAQESPTYQWIEGGYFTSELAGVSVANNSGKPYYESYAPAGQNKSFGFINQTTSGSSFTSTAATASMVLYQGGNIALAPTQGNVGIGTYSPTAKLEVIGEGSGSVKMGSTGFGGDWVGISLSGTLNTSNYNLLSSATNASFYLNRPTGGDMLFRHGNSDQMIIKSGGNVGIGTTSPSELLEVVGNIRANVSNGGGFMLTGASASGLVRAGATGLALRTNTTDRLTVDNSGNVGIGTTSPGVALDVNGSGIRIVDATNPNIYLNNGTVQWKTYLLSGGSHNFAINDAVRDVLTLGYNGAASYFQGCNVGIGTSSPSTKLHLYEAGASDVIFRITPADGGYDPLIQLTGQGNNITQEGFEVWYSNSVGDVHLSTTYPNSAAAIRFHTATGASKSTSNERMIITGDGNVGIGTTNPSQKLDVAGAISVSGSVIDYEVSPGLIGPGPAVNIISFTPGTHYAAFVDYVIKDASTGANQRVGTIQISISLAAAAAVLNEVTTVDIGNTSAITFAVAYGAPTWLTATNSGITPYDINYMVRYF